MAAMDQRAPSLRFASRVEGLAGEATSVWDVHIAAVSARAAGKDVIVMSVGDPDFATPEPIVDSAIAALRAGDTHYTGIHGRAALRKAIAEASMRAGGPEVGPENVIVTAGAQNALFSAAMCLLSPGDEVVVLDPMYVTYEAALQASGAKIVRVACDPGTGFRPDLAALKKAVTPRSRAIFYANPNNPTGTVFTRDELRGIADVAKSHDLWVVSDEVYADLTFGAEHHAIAGLPAMAGRTVTIGSVSKSYAMTGWRCGWMVAPQDLVEHVHNLALCMNYGLPGFIQEAARHAIVESAEAVAEMRAIYRRRRDLVLAGLKPAATLKPMPPEAGMFFVVDIRDTGMSAATFSSELFRQKGVSVLDAEAFGAATKGFVRISFAAADAELEEGCRRICAFVAENT